MPDLAEPGVYRFDSFVLDQQTSTLSRLHPDGQKTLVRVGSRAFQILCLLVQRRGELVSQREIMDAVWPNIAVEQNNLTVQLSALRRVLDANGGQGSCIQNIPGRGYRLVPTTSQAGDNSADHDDEILGRDGVVDSSASELRPAASTTVPIVPRPFTVRWRSPMVWVGAFLLFTTVLLALAAAFLNRTPSFQTKNTAALAGAQPATAKVAERPRLSLVVLPFDNLGGAGLNDKTVESISDDLTNNLARMPGFTVIARNSAVAYKGKSVATAHVGQELGVRYAVDGSARKIAGALRVNVQLVSAETSEHLWAGRFDAARDGADDEVDDIVRQISAALRFQLINIESARSTRERPSNPDVTDLVLQALRNMQNLPLNPQNRAQAVALYERALELDPSPVEALAGLAEALLDSITVLAEDPTVPAKLNRAEKLVSRAELLRPDHIHVMLVRVYLLGMQRRCAELIPAAQRAIEAHPNLTGTHFWLGRCMLFNGQTADAIPHIEQSIRINPRNPQVFLRYRLMGEALLYLGRYGEAVAWFHKSLAANPGASAQVRGGLHALIAAAQALAGDLDQGRLSGVEASRIWPTLTARSYHPFRITHPVYAAQITRVREGLQRAGIRDHADEDAESGLLPNDVLNTDYQAPTPTSVPGAQTIRTPDLAVLMEQRKPLVLDTNPWGKSVPGAIGLWGAGIGGSTSDEFQERLRQKMQQLTGGDRNVPVVAMGWNAERFQSCNLARRLVALGYSKVYWYRGGHEAWEVAGLPETELVMEDW